MAWQPATTAPRPAQRGGTGGGGSAGRGALPVVECFRRDDAGQFGDGRSGGAAAVTPGRRRAAVAAQCAGGAAMEREPCGEVPGREPQHFVPADAQAAHSGDAQRLSGGPAAAGARFAWAVTGSGHWLTESLALAQRLPQVDLFLSGAAEEVLPLY